MSDYNSPLSCLFFPIVMEGNIIYNPRIVSDKINKDKEPGKLFTKYCNN